MICRIKFFIDFPKILQLNRIWNEYPYRRVDGWVNIPNVARNAVGKRNTWTKDEWMGKKN